MRSEREFIQNIEKNQSIIHKISHLYFDTKEDREDFFQDVLLRTWKAFPNFEGRSKFSTWLYKIALNTALSRLRSKKNTIDTVDLTEINADVEEESNDYEVNVNMLYKAIHSLDDVDKSVTLLYLDKLSYKEISEITGMTETNVGVKINRIKQKLKIILNDV